MIHADAELKLRRIIGIVKEAPIIMKNATG